MSKDITIKVLPIAHLSVQAWTGMACNRTCTPPHTPDLISDVRRSHT